MLSERAIHSKLSGRQTKQYYVCDELSKLHREPFQWAHDANVTEHLLRQLRWSHIGRTVGDCAGGILVAEGGRHHSVPLRMTLASSACSCA